MDFNKEAAEKISTIQNCATPEEATAMIDTWACAYDNDLRHVGYTGPDVGAQLLADHFITSRDKVKILDVAAGTGLCGQKLKNFGFTNIDALDPSREMLDIAEQKGLYKRYICDYVNDKRLDIDDDTYDAVIIVGGFGKGYMPCCALYELIRIVKPGGVICILNRQEHFKLVEEYKDRFEPLVDQLEQQGKWKCLIKSTFPQWLLRADGSKVVGIQFLYQVC